MMSSKRSVPLLLLLFFACTVSAMSQNVVVDFRQAANNDSPYNLGDVHWINSIVQRNNSAYVEGMSVPQRIMFANVRSTPGNLHTMTFSHQATKNGKHAYDFLTSYDQALAASNAIAGPTTLVNLNECGAAMGPPSTLASTCASIHAGPYSFIVPVPDAMGSLLSHSIASSVANYETRFGNRTIKLYGNAPIFSASLAFNGYTSGKDATAEYTLSWSSASNSVLIEMAGHLSMGLDVAAAGTGIGYGSGLGAGSIPGGSYHFKLDRLDGASLGSRDNQIMGSAVLIPIQCNVGGPNVVCAGTQSVYAFNTSVRGYTYLWSLSNNTSGASIVGSNTGQSVTVNAGTGQGGYLLTVSVSDGAQTVNCPFPVTINAVNASATPTPILCHGHNSEVTVAATGGRPPYNGVGKFNRAAGRHDFTVTDANGCSTVTSVMIPEPPPCTITAVATPILCSGGNSTVTITASGGTPPYIGTGTFVRTAGTYSFTITDANNCTATTSVTITQPGQFTVAANATPISCNGGNSTVTVTATGGTPPYTGTGTFSKAAGTYTFTVTDANGCTSSSPSVTITAPPQLVASSSATPLPCGAGLSTVTVSAVGGTPPYAGTGTFSRPAGTYNFTVTDANNCSAVTTVTVAGGSSINVTASATPILCGGGFSVVTVTATGGTPPYTGTGAFNRAAGQHTFTVTDAGNCTGTANVTITEPPALTAAAAATPILCTGGNSTVTVTATGGTPPYIGTGAFTRGAGIFTFTVTDANNCTATATATITAPPTLTVAATATPILCNGSTSTVTVTATGGTAPYTGTGSFSRTAGTYSFTVTDANGCSAMASLSITQPPSLTASSSATPVVCNSGNSTVTVSATGGTPPYSGTGVFSRPAGNYTFTVTDANNCQATTSVTITGSSSIVVTASAPPILCFGGTSAVTVTATGGTPPYTGTGVFPRSAGTHIFTVTDANSCSSADTITISQPPALIAASSATPILCSGGNSTVTVTASGGTPPYTGTGVFTRGAGIFTFTVTDANNCSATTTASITAPPTVTVTASATPILCNGSTSTVTVTATGGTAPFTGTGNFSRTAGTYNFTVTDANGCSGTASVTITQPPTLTAASSATPILCGGGNSTVTVSATGGTPPYSGTGVFSRPAGTYTFTVTDANNCSATTTVTIIGSSSLIATASATPILCNGNTSTVTVAASGGTPPYTGTGAFTRGAGTFSFTVTDANNCSAIASVTITQPPTLTAASSATPILCFGGSSTVTVTGAGGTPPYTGTGVFSRTAGTYNFTVTDANNCTATTSVSITQPPLLAAAASATPVSCNGGNTTITVTATGGTAPYTGTGVFSRPAGSYNFTVTDANGCSAVASVTVTQPPTLTAASMATPILCNGGNSTVTVTANGGTLPYTGVGSFVRSAGTYTFTVTDANNCSATTTVTITQPPTVAISAIAPPILCNGDSSTVTVTASGGTPPYAGTGTFRRIAGVYSFTVTDANGCAATMQVSIVQPPQLIATANVTPILCHGDTAQVDVSATGGTPPYSGTGRFGRRPGSFDFIVVDANGCRDTVSVTLTEPPLLIVSHTATPILCYGGLSTVTVTAVGGTPPYTGVGNVSRPAGTHILTVTDANGCVDTTVVVLTQPPALVATSAAPPILCHGGTTTITVAATGGTPPYSGTGAFGRAAGTYSFPVTDANGCTSITTISIPNPPLLTASVFATPIRCHGDTSTVTVTAYGGTQPYSGTGVFLRGPGTFTFTVTDGNGCTAIASVTITEPPLLIAASSATPILCNGGNSTVTVTATGGKPPYTGTGVFSRPAGTHTFTVTDSNNCVATTSVTITQPPALIVTASAPPARCNGDSTTVTVNVSGGTPPYSGAGSFRRLAGNYSFTVTDANGCTGTAQITVTQPLRLEADVQAAPILCFGDTARVDVTATGGTPPYTGIGSFGRRPGTWMFTVTDANGCIDTDTITLIEPPVLVASATATPILCYGGVSTVTITATGGTPPYSGVGNVSRPAGTHIFIVTDANGCLDSVIITLTQPPLLVASSTAPPILCKGGQTTITVTATGGTPPYSGTGSYVRNAGTYTFTVTDANGCTAQTTLSIPDPPQLHAAVFATPILCFGDTSIVTVTAYGGTGPYIGTGIYRRGPGTFSFVVTDANGCTASVQVTILEPPLLLAASTALPILCHGGTTNVTVTASGGTPPYRGTGVFARPAGTHTFTVTDTNGCTATTSITITQPPLLVAAATAPPVTCSYDYSTVTVTASGGTPPYTGIGTFSRPVGTHNFTVTDANGCTANVSITIVGPPPLVAAAVATPILCNGGMSNVTVTATGGTPGYIGTGVYIRGAGLHTFIVRDINNCVDTVQISLFDPPPLIAICDVTPCDPVTNTRTINVTVHGGTPPYTYGWTPGNRTTQSFTVSCHDANTYTVVVRDANWNSNNPYNAGCQTTCSVSLVGFTGDDPVDNATARSVDGRNGSGNANDAERDPMIFGSQKTSAAHPADEYALFENYPNPFNPATTIRYYVPEASYVRLTVLNTYGQVVATLVDDRVETGTHFARWSAKDEHGSAVPSGSYFYRIHATSVISKREFIRERLMLLLK